MVSFTDWSATRLVVIVVLVGTAGVSVGTLVGRYIVPAQKGNAESERSAVPPASAEATIVAAPEDGTPSEGGFPGAPTRINEFGIPVGYPRTEAGAISACGNYVSAYLRTENREPSRIQSVFRSIGVEATHAQLAEAIVQADTTTAENFGVLSINSPGMGFNIRAVGYEVELYEPDEARIVIWSTSSVGIYGSTDQKRPRETWGTDTCTVRWIDADWRLSDAGDGPESPVITDRSSEAFQRFVLLGAAS